MANDGHPRTRAPGSRGGVDRNSPTTPANVRTTLETMQQAAQLRAAGATFREIGEALSIDHTWARTLVLRALESATYEAATLMRTQEGLRLDRLQRSYWQQALAGDERAGRLIIRIMERRARLFGLDAPVTVEVATSEVDQQITQLAASLGLGDDDSDAA